MESLEFVRNDLLKIGACRRGTLVVFPPDSNKQQKIATGDLNGVIQCFSIKRQQCKTIFKSLPSRTNITSLTLGLGVSQRDRLFFAEGAIIRGFTKKGKEFYRFDTNLTESINGIIVKDATIAVLAEYTCATFEENKEKGFYLSPDRINAFAPIFVEGRLDLVLACQDRSIRIISNDEVQHRIAIQSTATILLVETNQQRGFSSEVVEILYGTESGTVGQLCYNADGLRQGFVLDNADSRGAVTAICAGVDVAKELRYDIVVGRDDGWVEVYTRDSTTGTSKAFDYRLGDRINTLTAGYIRSCREQDLLVQTYTGKIIALSYQRSGLFAGNALKYNSCFPNQEEEGNGLERLEFLVAKIDGVKAEISAVAKQIKEKKELISSFSNVSSIPAVNIEQSCRLDSNTNCFVLTIESEKPILSIALCCDVPIKLVPTQHNVAILSISPPDTRQGFPLLATLRCQESSNRVDIRFKTKEGVPGCLTSFILPKISPKYAFSKQHHILPLCYHLRVQDASDDGGSILRLNGDFTSEDVCIWFASLLPDFPQQWLSNETLCFRNDVSGNVLQIDRKQESVYISSQDIVALDILREALAKECSRRNREIQIEIKIDSDSSKKRVEKLWMEVTTKKRRREQMAIIHALRELHDQEGNLDFLDDELKELWTYASRETKEDQSHENESLEDLVEFLICYQRLVGSLGGMTSRSEIEVIVQNGKTTAETLLELLQTQS